MSDKTYSEVCNQPAFDWHKALSDPSKFDHEELRDRAHCWVTCACGNMCAIIPRGFAGAPLDTELCILGLDFSDFIDSQQWEEAEDTLADIEARSAILIAEELAKRNSSYAESAQEQSE